MRNISLGKNTEGSGDGLTPEQAANVEKIPAMEAEIAQLGLEVGKNDSEGLKKRVKDLEAAGGANITDEHLTAIAERIDLTEYTKSALRFIDGTKEANYKIGIVDGGTGAVNSGLKDCRYFELNIGIGEFDVLKCYAFSTSGTSRGIAFYDSEGAFISGIRPYYDILYTSRNTVMDFAIPYNTALIRVQQNTKAPYDAELRNDTKEGTFNYLTKKIENQFEYVDALKDSNFSEFLKNDSTKYNVAIDIFNGGSTVYHNSLLGNKSNYINPAINLRSITDETPYAIFQKVGGNGYELTNGTLQCSNRPFFFWIKKSDLGDGIISVKLPSGATSEDITAMTLDYIYNKGTIMQKQASTPIRMGQILAYKKVIEAVESDGSFSEIEEEYYFIAAYDSTNLSNSVYIPFTLAEGSTGRLVYYNPSAFHDIDFVPDHSKIYKSYAQIHNSSLIGKNVLIMGDSQQNDNRTAYWIAFFTGANVYNFQSGGFSLGYKNSTSWLINRHMTSLRLIPQIDATAFITSYNDNYTSGTLTSESIQDVLENYPTIYDSEEVYAGKMAKFEALSDAERISIFAFKQMYAAMIFQIMKKFPECQFNACNLSVTVHGGGGEITIAEDGIGSYVSEFGALESREANMESYVLRDAVTREIASYMNVNVIDLMNKAGLTFENYPYFAGQNSGVADRIHFKSEAKIRWGKTISDEITHSNTSDKIFIG